MLVKQLSDARSALAESYFSGALAYPVMVELSYVETDMEYEDIEYEVKDGVATLELTGPAISTVTAGMVGEVLSAIDAADRDDEVRVMILTGRGRAFSAGADLSAGAQTFDYDDERSGDAVGAERVANAAAPRDGCGRITLRLFDCRKPVIAAVNGPAVGMGATMLLAADIRLASDSARSGSCSRDEESRRKERRLGSSPG